MNDPGWERHLTRRGVLAAGAATAFLAACGGSTDSESEDDDKSADKTKTAAELGGTLHYYNWADYANPETYTAFTEETG